MQVCGMGVVEVTKRQYERTDAATTRIAEDPPRACLVLVDCLIWLRNTVTPEDVHGQQLLADVEELMAWPPEPNKGHANRRGPRT